MASDERGRNEPRRGDLQGWDEGADMRGPYGGAGDYGGSYTAGGFTGAGFGGGYLGYGIDSDLGGYGPGLGGAGGWRYGAREPGDVGVSESVYGRPSYAGRGPRGYTRSDERIEEDVCDALTENPDIDASDIEVMVRDGVVTLRGTVPDRRSKYLAEDLAEATLGVRDVDDQLRRSDRGR